MDSPWPLRLPFLNSRTDVFDAERRVKHCVHKVLGSSSNSLISMWLARAAVDMPIEAAH